jgi:two-component system chemotaxis response regulator CheB
LISSSLQSPALVARPVPGFDVPGYDLVVIGGSAGGIAALHALLGPLPASFPLPILVVQHLAPTLPSRLPAVLGYRTALRCKWAEEGERLKGGTVYVGPPDRHLLVTPHRRARLCDGPRQGWWRPAVDRLFESAAEGFGERAVGIVLSGAMWDGASGIAALREAGALTLAQDEPSAGHFDMPACAIDLGKADVVLPPAKIAQALQVLAN